MGRRARTLALHATHPKGNHYCCPATAAEQGEKHTHVRKEIGKGNREKKGKYWLQTPARDWGWGRGAEGFLGGNERLQRQQLLGPLQHLLVGGQGGGSGVGIVA